MEELNLFNDYCKATNSKGKACRDLAKKAIELNRACFEDGTLLSTLVSYKETSFGKALTKYIINHALDFKTKELDFEQQKEIKTATPTELSLLEKTLAEVVVKNRGDEIKSEIVGNLEKQVADFIQNNYGNITRKVTLEVGDNKKIKFDGEVLHKKFDSVLQMVANDEPVFLTGRAGTGKNVLCKQVAKALDLPFYFTNAVTQEYKLTGFTDANGIFHETQFYKAFKNGGLFMLDEMDASIPEVLVILNAAIANRYFDFPTGKDKEGNEIGGFTEANKNFRLISAGNTFGLGADYEYVGRNQLDMASLDRFGVIEIDYDREIEKNVANGDEELVDFADELRDNATKNGVRIVVSYRSIGRIAKMQSLLGIENAMKVCLFKGMQADDINTLICSMNVQNKYVIATKKMYKL